MTHKAIVMGSTGLVGQHLLRQLAESGDYSEVIAITRRNTLPDHPLIKPLLVTDFAQLAEALAHLDLQDADAFNVLGTTIKQAGSQAKFRAVDHGYAVSFARACLERGARHFLLLSATGANPHSKIFYNQIKGETERDIRSLGFLNYSIFQPSLLLGEHQDARLGEHLAQQAFAWVKGIIPPTFAYRPIEAERVAQSMAVAAMSAAAQANSAAPQALAMREHLYSNVDMLALTLENAP